MWAEMRKSSIRPLLQWEEEAQEAVLRVSGRIVQGGEGKTMHIVTLGLSPCRKLIPQYKYKYHDQGNGILIYI